MNFSETLSWEDELKPLIINGEVLKQVPYFQRATYRESNPSLPVYKVNKQVSFGGEAIVSIRDIQYERYSAGGRELASLLNSELDIEVVTGNARGNHIATLSFVPLRINPNTGIIEKVVSFDFDVWIDASTYRTSGSNTYAENSVLASGDWYKLAIGKTGIYKIDYSFLSSLGINVDQIDPRNIRIYGNGGGMLPEPNSIERFDDLEENAIYISGESNGSFDQGNYILFYGESPDEIYFDENERKFKHQKHIYSEKTYYFITVGNSPGKRVSDKAIVSGQNYITSQFSEYVFHEEDKVNLIKSGKQWYGENFGFAVSSRTFNFQVPGIVANAPVYMESAFAARSITNQSTFTISVNGQQQTNRTIGTVSSNYVSAYANRSLAKDTFQTTGNALNVTVNFQNASSVAEGWLDFIGFNLRRNLAYHGTPLVFSDIESFQSGRITEYRVTGMQSDFWVWDITHPTSVRRMQGNFSGDEFRFMDNTDKELKRYIAFNPNGNFPTPESAGKVDNQNLHAIQQADMIIVYHPITRSAAEQLANHHRNTKGFNIVTVNVNHIYNEFSSGTPDLAAIRDFVKMLYDRNVGNPNLQPRYLLLFGNGSYDQRDILGYGGNLIPTFQSIESLGPVSSYVTDDFFGLLDEDEGGNLSSPSHKLDIAIGRLPARNAEHAANMVNKIIHYESTTSFGSWRNDLVFIADDGDNNLHLRDTDLLADTLSNNYPLYNVNKIYFDSYSRVSTPGGARFPEAQQALNNQIFRGALMVNYLGHGGVNGWAHERVLTISDILSWDNYDKMPLFVTATCEFSRYDDPSNISAGEHVLLNPKGGGIGLVTTVRLVYASANKELNQSFLEHVFELANGEMPTTGEILMNAKNFGGFNSMINSRKFVLLGDPAMKLAYPEHTVHTTRITEVIPDIDTDTLKALGKYRIEGEVRGQNGSVLENYNGIVYPRVFDKNVTIETLGQSSDSQKREFYLRKNIIYNGQATVTNGRFEFTFIVPKDIMFKFGQGKISYYADNTFTDAGGHDTSIVIGGTSEYFTEDTDGPDIEIYMNDESFVFGGLTDPNPILLVKLRDESGINTVGSGIGHDLTAVLDDDTRNVFVLNDFYESDLDDFRKGTVKYPIGDLEEGRHTIRVKAWDVHNNSGEGYTEFVVAASAELALEHVFNYPNPFTTSTNFMFEHNQPGQVLNVMVQIFTVTGKLVKTIRQEILSEGYRVDNIHWNGLDDFGDKIGRGVYVYKVNVRSSNGLNAHKFEKLVILR